MDVCVDLTLSPVPLSLYQQSYLSLFLKQVIGMQNELHTISLLPARALSLYLSPLSLPHTFSLADTPSSTGYEDVETPHALSPSHALSPCLSHTRSLSLTHSLPHVMGMFKPHMRSLPHTLSFRVCPSHTLSPFLLLTRSLSLSLSLSRSLSLLLPHTFSLPDTHSYTGYGGAERTVHQLQPSNSLTRSFYLSLSLSLYIPDTISSTGDGNVERTLHHLRRARRDPRSLQGRIPLPFSSHRMRSLIGFRKSTSPQDWQAVVYYY